MTPAKAIEVLASAFSADLAPETVLIHLDAIKDLTEAESLERAVRTIILTDEFYPRPARIREAYAYERRNSALTDSAKKAIGSASAPRTAKDIGLAGVERARARLAETTPYLAYKPKKRPAR